MPFTTKFIRYGIIGWAVSWHKISLSGNSGNTLGNIISDMEAYVINMLLNIPLATGGS